MPIDVSIDLKNNLVRRKIWGEVSVEEMVASLEDVLSHPDYRPGMNDLTDLRDHVHRATGDDVRKAAKAINERSHLAGSVKLACVVSRTVSHGLTRMFQILADESPWEMAAFYDLDEAERWLGVT